MKPAIHQQRVINDWIRQKIEQPTCQLCQSNDWAIGQLLVPAAHDATEYASGSMVQLVCQNCGQVLLFDVSRINGWHPVDTTSSLLW